MPYLRELLIATNIYIYIKSPLSFDDREPSRHHSIFAGLREQVQLILGSVVSMKAGFCLCVFVISYSGFCLVDV